MYHSFIQKVQECVPYIWLITDNFLLLMSPFALSAYETKIREIDILPETLDAILTWLNRMLQLIGSMTDHVRTTVVDIRSLIS